MVGRPADLVRVLTGPLGPAAIAAWLTGANPALPGRRPIDALRSAEHDQVVGVARRSVDRVAR